MWALGEAVLPDYLVLVVAGEERCVSLSTTEQEEDEWSDNRSVSLYY